jgi:hypothetical protein
LLEATVLGPVGARIRGTSVPIKGRLGRTVLACRQPVSVERLIDAEFGGAEQPGGLCLRIRAQRGRSLQARGGSGDRTAALRVRGRVFQLGRDLLVPSGDRGSPVPHRTVGLIGQDTRERRVRPLARGGRHGLPEGGTDAVKAPEQGSQLVVPPDQMLPGGHARRSEHSPESALLPIICVAGHFPGA